MTPVTGLGFVTALSGAMTVFCISNPKACFGSCPTFHAWNGQGMELEAEGFSSSIAPSLEATDVDALLHARATGEFFTVHVRNEALETQTLRSADLLVLTRPPNGRILRSPEGEFFEAANITPLRMAIAASGDILPLLADADGMEYFSRSDSANLAEREEVELTFDAPPGERVGLVVMSRQTLMTTFLLYQTLAYFGNGVGAWLAEVELGGEAAGERLRTTGTLLGQIEVNTPGRGGQWHLAGRLGETGPIAREVTVVPLGVAPADGRVVAQLNLTRGFWRLDWVALAHLGPTVLSARLSPVSVTSLGNDELPAGTTWEMRNSPLVLLPGDAYALTYRLPEPWSDREFFMESRGYYMEWIRSSWIEEENRERALLFLTEPAEYLRVLAPVYKSIEASMD